MSIPYECGFRGRSMLTCGRLLLLILVASRGTLTTAALRSQQSILRRVKVGSTVRFINIQRLILRNSVARSERILVYALSTVPLWRKYISALDVFVAPKLEGQLIGVDSVSYAWNGTTQPRE